MERIAQVLMAALVPLTDICRRILEMAPPLIAALVLLLIGGILAHWVRYFVGEILTAIRMDHHLERTRITDVVRRLGLGSSLSHLVGVLVYATILMAFVIGAADVLGLGILRAFLGRVLGFFPMVVAVVIVMAGGLFLGDIAGGIVHRAADENHVRGSELLMRMTHGLFVLFSAMMVLEMFGITVGMIMEHIQIIMAAIGLGFAIAAGVAFGLSGRDSAGRVIKDLMPNSSRGRPLVRPSPKMRVVK